MARLHCCNLLSFSMALLPQSHPSRLGQRGLFRWIPHECRAQCGSPKHPMTSNASPRTWPWRSSRRNRCRPAASPPRHGQVSCNLFYELASWLVQLVSLVGNPLTGKKETHLTTQLHDVGVSMRVGLMRLHVALVA